MQTWIMASLLYACQRSAVLVEMTVCYKTNFLDAHRRMRKESKYEDLVEAGLNNGFNMRSITLEVGS